PLRDITTIPGNTAPQTLATCSPQRIELVAAGRHRARTPEIGKTELIDLHRNVLGEDGSPVFPAFGGDASKGWKHWTSLRDINAVTPVIRLSSGRERNVGQNPH